MAICLDCEGDPLGSIVGSVNRPDHVGWLPVLSLEMKARNAAAIASERGAAAGHRQRRWEEVLITREADVATPMFYAALSNNSILQKMTFHFFGVTQDVGAYAEVVLTEPTVHSIKSHCGEGMMFDEISLAFRGIEINHLIDGTGFADIV